MTSAAVDRIRLPGTDPAPPTGEPNDVTRGALVVATADNGDAAVGGAALGGAECPEEDAAAAARAQADEDAMVAAVVAAAVKAKEEAAAAAAVVKEASAAAAAAEKMAAAAKVMEERAAAARAKEEECPPPSLPDDVTDRSLVVATVPGDAAAALGGSECPPAPSRSPPDDPAPCKDAVMGAEEGEVGKEGEKGEGGEAGEGGEEEPPQDGAAKEEQPDATVAASWGPGEEHYENVLRSLREAIQDNLPKLDGAQNEEDSNGSPLQEKSRQAAVVHTRSGFRGRAW
jgi:hypothetical protein